MKLLKMISVAATAAVVMASGGTQTQAASALQDILSGGVLKVGTTGDWNPMTMKDPATNSYKGYDIDVMTELAKDLGVKVEFVPTDWKTLVSGVTTGKYHMTGSASISPSRMKVSGFSTSYISVEISPFTTEDKASRFNGWDSINKPGVNVSATLGTTFEKYVKLWFPNATLNIVEAPALGHQEVISGRSDVFITSNIEGATLMSKFANVKAISVKAPRAPSPIAMLLPQSDQVWINYVNNWIKVKQLGGFFDKTAAKWGM